MRVRRRTAGVLAGVLLVGSAVALSTTSALAVPVLQGTFRVSKDFSDNNTSSVTVNLVCTGQFTQVIPVKTTASEGSPATFTVNFNNPAPTCTAQETPIPPGYVGSGSPAGSCSAQIAANPTGAGCTITNTRTQITVTSDDDDEEDEETVTVTGSGFPPNTKVEVDIHSESEELGSVTSDANGSFEKTFEVPCSVGDGEHEVTATAETGQRAEADVELEGCSDEAPVAAAQPVTVTPKFTG
jgi:hypothetical protein